MAIDINSVSPGAQIPAPAEDAGMRERIEVAIQRATSDVAAGSKPDFQELTGAVARINEAMKAYGLQFNMSEVGNRIVTKIVERDTGEVIRQIPDDTVLHVSQRLDKVIGLLFQETA